MTHRLMRQKAAAPSNYAANAFSKGEILLDNSNGAISQTRSKIEQNY